jgi:hypothetical protein
VTGADHAAGEGARLIATVVYDDENKTITYERHAAGAAAPEGPVAPYPDDLDDGLPTPDGTTPAILRPAPPSPCDADFWLGELREAGWTEAAATLSSPRTTATVALVGTTAALAGNGSSRQPTASASSRPTRSPCGTRSPCARLRIDAIAIKTARVSTAKGWVFTVVGSGWVASDAPPRRRWYVAQGKLPKQKAILSDTLRVPVTWGSSCWFARIASRGTSLGTTITIAPKDAFGIAQFCTFRGDTALATVVTP